jgi:hypothetical protein
LGTRAIAWDLAQLAMAAAETGSPLGLWSGGAFFALPSAAADGTAP